MSTNDNPAIALLEAQRDQHLSAAEACERALAALTTNGAKAAAPPKRKPARKPKKVTPSGLQREIERYCVNSICEAHDEFLTTTTLHALVTKQFGGGRTAHATDQMLTLCPYFVRERGKGWRLVADAEWEEALAYSQKRGWPGPAEKPEILSASA